MKGQYKLKRQIAGRGIFASVSLEVEESEKFDVIVGDGVFCLQKCMAAVHTGIWYAKQMMRMEGHAIKNVRVTVTDIGYLTTDTTPLAMVFASAMAFYEALGLKPRSLPRIEPGGKAFIFPFREDYE
ncbi:MAG: hypothetical protein GF417_01480 [Candidatus Latescibacteria bacterium]|nr:hypothetical protein [Candidatus Latescibacterota bacterium]